MMPPKHRLFLKANANTYYYVDTAGVVQTITSPVDYSLYALKEYPANWQDLELRWERSPTYYGIFRSAATSLQFVKDGAAILRKVYFTESFEGECLIVIEERDDVTWDYDVMYEGNIDFAGINGERDKVIVPIVEGGLHSLLEANENTPYEIPLELSDCIMVYLDGVALRNNYRYGTLPGSHPSSGGAGGFIALPVYFIDKEAEYTTGLTKTVVEIDMFSPPSIFPANSTEQNNYFYESEGSTVVTVDLDFEMKMTNRIGNGTSTHLALKVVHWSAASASVVATPIIFVSSASVAPGTTSPNILITGSQTFTLADKDRLYLLYYASNFDGTVESGGPSGHVFINFGDDNAINARILFRRGPTTTRAYRYYQVLDKLVEKMTDGAHMAVSPFLYDPSITINLVDSRPYQLAVTSGDALRNLTVNTTFQIVDPALRLTLTQLFNDAHGRWLLGLGINNLGNLYIDQLSAFFDTAVYNGSFGEVTNFIISASKDYLFTQFKTGFSGYSETDKLNSRDEANTQSTWKMPFKSIPHNEVDFASPFRGDPTGIEYTRSNISNKKTTDTKSDNDIFLLDIDSTQTSGAYNLYRPNNSLNTSGIISPDTTFNISLSPARSLRRLGPLLSSVGNLQESKDITFQTNERNQYLESNIGSGNIIEDENVSIGTLASRLWKPVTFSFETLVTTNIKNIMASSPYGWWDGTFRGIPFSGFVINGGVKPAKSSAREWALICHPSCDLAAFL